MNTNIKDVLSESARIVWNNKMQGFIAIFVPVILGVIAMLIAVLIPVLNIILLPIIVVGMVFMIYKMSLSMVRRERANMDQSLTPFSGVFRLLGYSLLIGTVYFSILLGVAYLIAWDEINSFIEMFQNNNIYDMVLNDPTAFEQTIADFTLSLRPVFYVSLLLNLLLTLKLFMIPYLIVDGGKVFDSIKRSWNETTPHTINILLLTGFFMILNEVLNQVSVIFNNSPLGGLYSIAYLIFNLIFFLAFSVVAPAYLYNEIAGVPEGYSHVEDDPFVETKNEEDGWDF